MNIENEHPQKELIKSTYVDARDAIVNRLGKNADNEDILDVLMLLCHAVLTQGGAAELTYAAHNTAVFCVRLQELVEVTQQNVLPSGGSTRPM